MSLTFCELSSSQDQFFDRLPLDWQNLLVPNWNHLKNTSTIYIIKKDDLIIGGGIVFSTCPPDIAYYKNEAQQWFDKGYYYLGFIWIDEDWRNQNLGSYWMNQLKALNPKQKFWLLTEEEHLHRFYMKNGFILDKSIAIGNDTEWLYVFKPKESEDEMI